MQNRSRSDKLLNAYKFLDCTVCMTDAINSLLLEFSNFDRNKDGDPSIVKLEYLNFESSSDIITSDEKLVLILVEERLLGHTPVSGDLSNKLLRYKDDLRAEGFKTRFILCKLYHGSRHQDGRTLLAIRTFLQEIKKRFRNFLGVVLIGAFPESTLVRRVIWKQNYEKYINGVLTNGKNYLDISPELIAWSSDIVLMDLNGKWDSIYKEGPIDIEAISAMPDEATSKLSSWPIDSTEFVSDIFEVGKKTFQDIFSIQDESYQITEHTTTKLKIMIWHRLRNPELGDIDLTSRNPIARPDILVSRINALQAAINPDPSFLGDGNVTPIDSNGFPQSFTSSRDFDIYMLKRDPILEIKLLCDYFDRNHLFRIGAFADLPFRTASIATHEFSAEGLAKYLSTASSAFLPTPVVNESANLVDYIRWFKQPAVFRFIEAHSNSRSSVFDGNGNPDAPDIPDAVDIEREAGGNAFNWVRTGNKYTPGFQDRETIADILLHRTIWQNGILNKTGANIIIHGGCEVGAPEGTDTVPYYDENYASFQNGEAILFYMNTVAMIARSKIFNDIPSGFPGAFAISTRAHFGDGYKAFFDYESNDAGSAVFEAAIYSKKAYFWSMLGDWTVRLRYRNGIGLFGYQPTLKPIQIHADETWIDGWNLNCKRDVINGIGDFDGDGTSEFIITSEWGIAILKYSNSKWSQLMASPNDTWFGSWRYNASIDIGKDKIQAIGKFTNNKKSEILLTNSWGIGVLAMNSSTLTSIIIHPNGTSFGGWLFDSRANQIVGSGDLDKDGLDEIVIISDWGIGVLSSKIGTFDSTIISPNGTRFGGWLFDSLQNTIHKLSDFDGDGAMEILISSKWGIGILKLKLDTFVSIAIHSNGTNLSGYILNTDTMKIVGVGDLLGDKRSCVAIADKDGIHILQMQAHGLEQVVYLQNGFRAGKWLLNTTDNSFGPIGDLDGDGQDEILVSGPLGIGVLAIKDNRLECLTLYHYGSKIGEWILRKTDEIIGIGNFIGSSDKMEFIIKNN